MTGAFRMTFAGAGARCTSSSPRRRRHRRLSSTACWTPCHRNSPARLVLWPYARFPFGMSLDYERKFVHYVPGEQDPGGDGPELNSQLEGDHR